MGSCVQCFLVASRRRRISGGRFRRARGRRLLAAALLVEGKNLQLDSEINLADLDVVGTESTTGAKFKMLQIPDATRRSQTSCATSPGVAMTPMAA